MSYAETIFRVFQMQSRSREYEFELIFNCRNHYKITYGKTWIKFPVICFLHHRKIDFNANCSKVVYRRNALNGFKKIFESLLFYISSRFIENN